MSYSLLALNSNNAPELTDIQQRYEAETGSTMFSKPPRRTGGRMSSRSGKDKKAFEEWSKTTAGMEAGENRFNEMMANRSQNPVLGQTQSGMSNFDKFQAMQAARKTGKNQAGATRFNESMNVNPLVLQQLQQMQAARAQQPQLQMRPQFNAFGFGAQPGLAAQGGQGGSMLANMSSQGMNQLAAGQQNNPTIFKAKS